MSGRGRSPGEPNRETRCADGLDHLGAAALRQPPAPALGRVGRWSVRSNAEAAGTGSGACVADLNDDPTGTRSDHHAYRWRTVPMRVGHDLADGEDQSFGIAGGEAQARDHVGHGTTSDLG